MACDCVKNLNKKLKEQFNETATMNVEVLSQRVIVTGLYHKPKGKTGGYQSKWDEINLWPQYCPFCGKPYDIKDIYGKKAVELREHLICTNVELNNWDYDDDGMKYPKAYTLAFRFHGVQVTATLSTGDLFEGDIKFGTVECDGDLLASFEDVFEQNDFTVEISNLCEGCWKDEEEESKYNFVGDKNE